MTCPAHPTPRLEQEAYELIMGKRSGKDLEGVPGNRSSWSFHDWCAAAAAVALPY